MQPVLTIDDMRAVDARAVLTQPIEALIERAGRAVAVAALELLGGAYGRRVAVLVGPGNNGADGRVAARVLAARGARVTLLRTDHLRSPGPCDLVIDAAFGTGFRGAFDGPPVDQATPVLAVDIPSGVHGDSGEASGSPLTATRTVTFVARKPGLLQGDGPRLAGRVTVADIGLVPVASTLSLMEDADIAELLPPRSPGGNKWSAAVLVVAGSPGMTGAAALCARAAYRAGAGMVRLGVPGASLGEAPAAEAVSVALPSVEWSTDALQEAERCAAVVVGPGLGRSGQTAGEVRRLIEQSPVPVIVDADGLVAIAPVTDGGRLRADGRVVLTPHDGEYRQLMGSAPGTDRVAAARALSAAAHGVALVKGPTTAVADLDDKVRLATAGTTALATAGTGDVLSGVIGAFVARGLELGAAAALAAHVHGRAGARGRAEGLVAGDLPDLVSDVVGAAGGQRRG